MKIVKTKYPDIIIYPLLNENDIEQEDDFRLVVSPDLLLLDSRSIYLDDIPKIIEGLERMLEEAGSL